MNAIIAFNPQQMADAQATTLSWADKKLAAAHAEVDEADEILNSLQQRGMNVTPAKRMLDKAAKRVRFYEKVKAALALGYYIIPPFDIQLFAVRVNRKPTTNISTRPWASEGRGQSLSIGEGRFVDPAVPRIPNGSTVTESAPLPSDLNRTREVQLYENGNWLDEINLPVRAMKPTIIDAVGKALEQKIFDALGIAPAYRAADPIIAGQIQRPEGGTLTFFVAWWLDESDI